MSNPTPDAPNQTTLEAIRTALETCYGSLQNPSFRKVSDRIRAGLHHSITQFFQSNGISVTDLTDLNTDVSLQLVLDVPGDQVGLGLSGVGPFASLLHQDAAARYIWVTHPDNAPTALAASVAQTVIRAGFQLLDRETVTRTIEMNWYDGATEVTLYQALFTDTDRIP